MRIKLVALRLFALAAMAVCMAMLVDYILPTPAFCGFRSGCEQVTRSIYGRPLGVLPPLGGLKAIRRR